MTIAKDMGQIAMYTLSHGDGRNLWGNLSFTFLIWQKHAARTPVIHILFILFPGPWFSEAKVRKTALQQHTAYLGWWPNTATWIMVISLSQSEVKNTGIKKFCSTLGIYVSSYKLFLPLQTIVTAVFFILFSPNMAELLKAMLGCATFVQPCLTTAGYTSDWKTFPALLQSRPTVNKWS